MYSYSEMGFRMQFQPRPTTFAWLSLFGFAFIWSPFYGTVESATFPSIAASFQALMAARLLALSASIISLGVLMAILSRIDSIPNIPSATALAIAGSIGMTMEGIYAIGAAPETCLFAGALLRGIFSTWAFMMWIATLVRFDGKNAAIAISLALVVYGIVQVGLFLLAAYWPNASVVGLAACPIVACIGCVESARAISNPNHEEKDKGANETGAVKRHAITFFLFADLGFGFLMGLIMNLYPQDAEFPTAVCYLVVACLSLAVFAFSQLANNLSYLLKMLLFVMVVALTALLLGGTMNGLLQHLCVTAMTVVLTCFGVLTYADTQTRLEGNRGRASLFLILVNAGMALSTFYLMAIGEEYFQDSALLLVAVLCVVLISTAAIPDIRTEARPWGFASLIPVQSPEARRQQRISTLAEEAGLTPREYEAFLLLVEGKSRSDIADTLVIAVGTAKAYVHNIYAKLGVHSYNEFRRLVDGEVED